MPPIGHLKYILLLVDHLTGWVEAFRTSRATASMVSKIILEQIIPRYGMVSVIDSDQGTHFTSKVLKGVMEGVRIKWESSELWKN